MSPKKSARDLDLVKRRGKMPQEAKKKSAKLALEESGIKGKKNKTTAAKRTKKG